MFKLAFAAMLGVVLCTPAQATIVVTTNSGARNVQGACALRDALVAANTLAPAGGCPAGQFDEVIVLPAGQTIILTERDPDSIAAGLPPIVNIRSVTLQGNGATIARSTAVACNRDGVLDPGEFRLFEVYGSLHLQNLTLRNGCADDTMYAIGGGIRLFGSSDLSTDRLTLDRVTLYGNAARYQGGGMWVEGVHVAVRESTLQLNLASQGGAIYNANAMLRIERSLLRQNQLVDFPGPIPARGSAIANAGTLTLLNSTVAGNLDFSTDGGGTVTGLYTPGHSGPSSLVVRFSTIASNFGIGLYTPLNEFAQTYLINSIVANQTQSNCNFQGSSGDQHYSGLNLISDFSHCYAPGNPALLNNVDPKLTALADNGGPTLSMAIASNSPAINAAPECTDGQFALPTDQRLTLRPAGAACDVGAFEWQDGVFKNSFD